MTFDQDAANEKPAVIYNGNDNSAYYEFRGQRYTLPGKYYSFGQAMAVAEKQCRAMGWKG